MKERLVSRPSRDPLHYTADDFPSVVQNTKASSMLVSLIEKMTSDVTDLTNVCTVNLLKITNVCTMNLLKTCLTSPCVSFILLLRSVIKPFLLLINIEHMIR